MFADDQGLCGTNVFDVHHVAGRSVQGRMGSALEIPVLQALAPQARGDEAVAWQRSKADVRARVRAAPQAVRGARARPVARGRAARRGAGTTRGRPTL